MSRFPRYNKKNMPNILLFITDQHRADLMTCSGESIVDTPNIDRIARRGVRFENAYCTSPVCAPSRTSLLTGLYPHTHGVITNRDRLNWRYRTIAHFFADSGYLTSLIGKMHFRDAHKHGFEYYLSINDWLMYLGPKVKDYANEVASHPLSLTFFKTVTDEGAGFPDVADLWQDKSPWVGNVTRLSFSSMASSIQAEDHLDSFVARESIKFMKRYRKEQFFLVASFMKPHTPLFPPREWAEKYPIEDMDLPPSGNINTYPPHIQERIKKYESIDPNLRRAHISGYLGNVAFVDACIGHVLDALDELDLRENTIVVYTSDHGEMNGEHGLYQKFCMFEPAVRVPLIVSCPEVIPQGKVTQALTEYFGLYPTLADLVGLSKSNMGIPQMLDSRSFRNILADPERAGSDAVFCEYDLRSDVPKYMIRTRRYKYIFNDCSSHELYDLEADSKESVNLIDEPNFQDIQKELRKRLFEWFNPFKNPFRQMSNQKRQVK